MSFYLKVLLCAIKVQVRLFPLEIDVKILAVKAKMFVGDLLLAMESVPINQKPKHQG